MFYQNQFPDRSAHADRESLLRAHWLSLAAKFHLQAILLIKCNIEHSFFTIESAFGVPAEPFNGSDKEYVAEVVNDCFQKHPKTHVHAITNSKLPERIQKFNQKLVETHRVWFCPLRIGSDHFVFLGFPDANAGKTIDTEFEFWVTQATFALVTHMRAEELLHHIQTTEVFIKEVGHDITSSVQAILAKLRNIAERRITGESVIRKAREIEEEIWSTHRISESLGVVIAPTYTLTEPVRFNVVEALKVARDHHLSEAEERHMKLILETDGTVNAWGDKKAIEQALGHLLSNAVKYGEGGSVITISATERRDDILIRVTNKGMPLPKEPEVYYIWDFGIRGKNAKELHVNGSGIGLYTVKKIANAHHAKVTASSQNGATSFFIQLPNEAKLKKSLQLLV